MLSNLSRWLDPDEWLSHDALMQKLCHAADIDDYLTVARCLKLLKARGKLPDALNVPTFVLHYTSGYEGRKPSYLSIIQLLEAGARPEAENELIMNVFLVAATKQDLTMFRLLLWFESDKPEHHYITALKESSFPYGAARCWRLTHPRILDALAEIASDFRRARQHLQTAAQAENVNDPWLAGVNYHEAAKICLKHHDVEQAVAQSRGPDTPRNTAAPAFFKARALEYQTKAYENLQLADTAYKHLAHSVGLSPKGKQAHKQVLTLLTKLAAAFEETHAAADYQMRADRLAPPLENDSSTSLEGEDPSSVQQLAAVLRKREVPRYDTADPAGAPAQRDELEPAPVV